MMPRTYSIRATAASRQVASWRGALAMSRPSTPGAGLPIMDETRNGPIATTWCPIVELRQYALHLGRREDLIELFDREMIEPQEAVGLTVMGQFRDIDDPNAFIWLRGFASMDSRAAALSSFYDGPVWRTCR